MPGSRAQNSGSPWRSTIAASPGSASQSAVAVDLKAEASSTVPRYASGACMVSSMANGRTLSTQTDLGLLALGLLLLPR